MKLAQKTEGVDSIFIKCHSRPLFRLDGGSVAKKRLFNVKTCFEGTSSGGFMFAKKFFIW